MAEIVSTELTEIAERIREEHQAAIQSMRKGIEHALKVGELLVLARKEIKHGNWTDWVETNCEFTPRMARHYMKLYLNRTVLKTETVSEMTLRGALEEIYWETRTKEREKSGVTNWNEWKKEKKKRWKLESEDNQVKAYLEGLKVFVKSISEAKDAAEFGKFSPEGKKFTVRRNNEVRRELDSLETMFFKGEVSYSWFKNETTREMLEAVKRIRTGISSLFFAEEDAETALLLLEKMKGYLQETVEEIDKFFGEKKKEEAED